MKLFALRCGLTLVLALSFVSLSQARSDDLAEQYFERSGMGLMLGALSESIAGRLNLSRLRDSNIPIHAQAPELMKQALQEADGRLMALDYLRTEVEPAMLQQTYAFLQSPLGTKVTKAEAQASTPEGQAALQEFRLSLASNPAPQERELVIRDLVSAAHMVESMMQLLERLYLMLPEIARQTAAAEQAEPFAKTLNEEWVSLKPALQMQFEQLVMLGAHFSYRELSVEELKQYARFLSEPRGRVYWESSMRVVDRYLDRFLAKYTALLNTGTQDAS